ncbi:polysaccharide biosynthesis tyrosine autokinase [Arthrobacter sp. YJM1]|uniref:Polysaccharide biosynthesis tyrosine autokinase n=1 Tax=Arthrobacter horti TaxID=3068273 RepID=A0ABT9IRP0_9MICC|nr:polysaccharide biosynthesis tyrosine autokinase [Arthrobacter sp. YJM1]
MQPKVYSSDASGILSAGDTSDLGSAMTSDSYAKSRIKSYMYLAKSRVVAEDVAKKLKLQDSPEELIGRVTVVNPEDTPTMKVTATGSTPEQARDLAEAWVQGIGAQVTALESSTGAAQTTTLPDGQKQVTKKSVIDFRSMDSASLPSAPSSPNLKMALLMGLAVGMILGVAYAFVRNPFDRRIKSSSDLNNKTGVPVVATVPADKEMAAKRTILDYNASGSDASYRIAEALRKLRTNLQFMDVDQPPRVIVVTSPMPGEGKSTITANLAQTLAASGQRVVVIDADLRKPTQAEIFGLPGTVGLTDVLVGRARLEDVLQPWGETGNLFVLSSGEIPPNPSELLASKAMRTLLDRLQETAMILVDAPPLLPVTDAAILTARTDGALIVTRAGRSTYDALDAALDNLKRVSGRALGIVLNGAAVRGVNADRYAYSNYYGRKQRGAAPAAAETAQPASEVQAPAAVPVPSEAAAQEYHGEFPQAVFTETARSGSALDDRVRQAAKAQMRRGKRPVR